MSILSPESGFTPRREFVRDQQATTNSFSLLAIAGANCIRLYSFPLPLMTALRKLLDQQNLVTELRENIEQQMCEIVLAGKPWTSAKSLPTEKLILEILAVVYQHGYSYLSTIDYGRESDDRLAMAFSKPGGARPRSPFPPSEASPVPTSLSLNTHAKRIPFALSFTSATMMRVIAPPLHSTPAILQAVRGAWPRGVVSEKKVGGNCFEFKLKGYKWFHEDTFATDSLRHILSLLSSLDAHSFTLLTSITLTSRSRVKDLWIFTGPAASSIDSLPESPAPSILNGSTSEFRRHEVLSPASMQSQQSLHRRLASEPTAGGSATHAHARAATDTPASSPHRYSQSNMLRKAAPRAQVPISVHDTDPAPEGEMFRANLPSVIPPGAENFTGVGASGRTPDVFYSTPPLSPNQAEAPFPLVLPVGDVSPPHPSSTHGSGPLGRGSPQTASSSSSPRLVPTPPLEPLPPLDEGPAREQMPDSDPSPHLVLTPPLEPLPQSSHEQPTLVHSSPSTPGTPPLLGGAFRDSAFSSGGRDSAVSSATNSTYDAVPIPIKWTGTARDSLETQDSYGPTFPGGWQPTPIDERPEDAFNAPDGEEEQDGPTPDVQSVSHRVQSPDLQAADLALRKSEAGLVGLIAASETKDSTGEAGGEGKGWVVVDVEGKGGDTQSSPIITSPIVASPVPQSPTSPPSTSKKSTGSGTMSPSQQVSPAAKAIAIVDAIEAKQAKSTSSSDGPSGIKKLFSLGRKDSMRRKDAGAVPPSPSASSGSLSSKPQQPQVATEVSVDDTKRAIEMVHNASSDKGTRPEKEKPKKPSKLREKLRLLGTPEASRKEDKRRSIN
ncbi:hypothetical protein B0H16DRAFT_1876102 [Mycena metata]|uniref:Uncharacterized protein n=1 Tax=Mycena metata TaxID=1033252 RepID=A0AAD7P392_9AGAR|nr:hypothetical protein B0H16DRAFT_1876102 [Mycena metata]